MYSREKEGKNLENNDKKKIYKFKPNKNGSKVRKILSINDSL